MRGSLNMAPGYLADETHPSVRRSFGMTRKSFTSTTLRLRPAYTLSLSQCFHLPVYMLRKAARGMLVAANAALPAPGVLLDATTNRLLAEALRIAAVRSLLTDDMRASSGRAVERRAPCSCAVLPPATIQSLPVLNLLFENQKTYSFVQAN